MGISLQKGMKRTGRELLEKDSRESWAASVLKKATGTHKTQSDNIRLDLIDRNQLYACLKPIKVYRGIKSNAKRYIGR
jgi:hypothetical protein